MNRVEKISGLSLEKAQFLRENLRFFFFFFFFLQKLLLNLFQQIYFWL